MKWPLTGGRCCSRYTPPQADWLTCCHTSPRTLPPCKALSSKEVPQDGVQFTEPTSCSRRGWPGAWRPRWWPGRGCLRCSSATSPHWWTGWIYNPAAAWGPLVQGRWCANIPRIRCVVSYPSHLIGRSAILHNLYVAIYLRCQSCPPHPRELMKYSP